MSTKSLLITGASTGIGAETARAAVAAGWSVGLMARSRDKVEALAQELGESALALPGDVTSPEDQSAAVDKMVQSFGALNAAFANAGVGATRSGTEKGEIENWRQMIDVNIWGALLTAKTAYPELKKTGGDLIVTGSKAGRVTMRGSVYGATKWFIHGWADGLGDEMREWGGRCTIISPGLVDTPFFDEPKPQGLKPRDVARAVMYALDQPAGTMIGEIHLMPNPEAREG